MFDVIAYCASNMYLWLHIQSLVDIVSVLVWKSLMMTWKCRKMYESRLCKETLL